MLKYQIALINVFWSENDINNRFFESVDTQKSYFENKTSGLFSPLFNFNIANGVETSVIYRDNTGRSTSELLSCNYAVIEELNNNQVVNTRYYFAYPQQDSGNQLRVILSLDDIQTNYIKYRSNIAPCMINRACLNRFKINPDDTITFNNDITSNLLLNEGFENVGKVPTQRQKVKFKYTQYDNLNDWLNDNINGWVYVFVDPNQEYTIAQEDKLNKKYITYFSYDVNKQSIQSETGVIVYPIYNSTKQIIFKNSRTGTLSYLGEMGFVDFRTNNQNVSYVYNIKYSLKAPFNKLTGYNFEIDENGNLLITAPEDIAEKQFVLDLAYSGKVVMFDTTTNCVLTGCNDLNPTLTSYPVTLNVDFTFNKNDVINQPLNFKFNPKLNNTNFKELVITQNNGDSFVYDLQKIGTNEIEILYSEFIDPLISKSYVRLNPVGLYNNITSLNYTGLLTSIDNSVLSVNDQYSNFIANNKNFWLQSNLNIGFDAVNQILNQPTFSGLISTAVSTTKNIINRNLTINNIQNSPSTLKNANGNVLFNIQINELGVYCELREAVDIDKNVVNDFLNDNGFVLGIMDYITNYDNIRVTFNYVEADVDTINAPLSNIEKERLKNKLKSIRFWNSDLISYQNENYERSLL